MQIFLQHTCRKTSVNTGKMIPEIHEAAASTKHPKQMMFLTVSRWETSHQEVIPGAGGASILYLNIVSCIGSHHSSVHTHIFVCKSWFKFVINSQYCSQEGYIRILEQTCFNCFSCHDRTLVENNLRKRRFHFCLTFIMLRKKLRV